jgi:diguanylate cyclase (GGDEF)-like protein/PAS domain S-box-containing protein
VFTLRDDHRISLAGMLIMVVLTLTAGVTVFIVMQRQAEAVLAKSLALVLQVRVERLNEALQRGITSTTEITTRPLFGRALQGLDDRDLSEKRQADLLGIAQSLVPAAFSAFALDDEHGNSVLQLGHFSANPELRVSLITPDPSTSAVLLRDGNMRLRVDVDIVTGGRRIGHLRTESSLPAIDTMLEEAGNLGKSGELALCAPLRQDMLCFQTRLSRHVLGRLARHHFGEALPMHYALDGRQGEIVAHDYRRQEVVAAYSPVARFGLGMVLKVDGAELFRPIQNQLRFIVPLLLGLLICGAALLRWQVMPLVRRLVRSEREARESSARLLASEANLSVLTALSPVGIFRTDPNGSTVYANERFREITGLSADQLRDQSWIQAVHPEDSERATAAWHDAIRQKQAFYGEHRLLRPDGSIRWVLTQATPQADAEGGITGYIGTVTDITARKHIEEALQSSEARYRNIVELSQEGIWQIDADNRTTFVNVKMAEMLGYTVAEMQGQPLFAFMDEEGRTITARNVERRRQGISEEHEFKFIRKDGSELWALLNTNPLVDPQGGYTGAFAMVSDITERRRAEMALRDSEERYRSVITAMREGVVIQRSDLSIAACNPSAEHILGLPMDQMMGRTSVDPLWQTIREDGSPFPGETHPAVVTLRTGQPQSDVVMGVRRTDGTDVWISINSQPLMRPDETLPYAVVTTFVDITERKRAERALIHSESNFRALTENANVGILVHHQGRHVFANPLLLSMLGYTLDEFRHTAMKDVVHPDEYEKVSARFLARQAGGAVPHVYETVLQAKDGRSIPVELTATTTTWEGSPGGLVLLQDISERRRAEEQMRKLSSAVEEIADSVLITNPEGIIEYVNPAFTSTTGFAREEVVGQTPRLLKSGKQGPGFYQKMWQTILAGDAFSDVFINRRKDGGLYYEEKTITPLKDANGRVTHFVSTGKDVTERTQIQERLQYIAQHDALTDLPNRVLLFDVLKRALARARRHGRQVAVMFIDLDRFKNINDSLGHEAGDKVLQQLSERFTRAVRSSDDLVARFGGDEFVIVLDDVANESDIREIAQKVLHALLPPFKVDHQQLYITASIGVSLFPGDGEDSSTLLKHADVAMYRAKDLGKNTYQFYSADMSARAFERLTLESSLRHALERGEFLLHYQPQLAVENGSIIGVEALLRWQHPEFGMVMPAEFMSLLEETGLIVPVGEWVLQAACAQLRVWHDAGWTGLRMAVNLSARQFHSTVLASAVERALALLDGGAERLELEITESVLMHNAAATEETLKKLAAMGCRIAIDDFGTGYSSLSYLKRFPLNVLKVDRSFVRDIPADNDDAAIVSTIVAMAHNLRLAVIAEGVETHEQLAFLRACGCDVMQGYLFSRPVPADQIKGLLETSMQTGPR